jgi:transcriptional regulator GlxA family with amidase domain
MSVISRIPEATAPLRLVSRGENEGGAEALSKAKVDPRLAHVLQTILSDPRVQVKSLARQVNLSPSRLQHIFKHQLGVRIRDFIGQERLRRAAWLLSHTDKRVKEITFEVGYGHSSSFVRAFQRHFSETPASYRRSQSRMC